MTTLKSTVAGGARAGLGMLLVAMGSAVAAPASGQGIDGRWQPWLGCWEPADVQTGAPLQGAPLLCIRSGPGGEAEFSTVSEAETTSRSIVADGRRAPISDAGCAGWESALFSRDARRVFLRSEYECGGTARALSSVMGWISPTEWVEVQAVGLAGETMMPDVRRFRLIDDARTRAAGFVPLSESDSRMAGSARTIAAAPLSIADVREASTQVASVALEALLLERGEGFELDATRIEELAGSGVSDNVIDIMVALSWPDRYRVDRNVAGGDIERDVRRGEAADDPYWRRRDPYGGYGRYGYRYCSPFEFGWSVFGYCSPYNYYGGGYLGGYYGGGYYGGFYGRPVIIVRGSSDDPDSPRGRVISGRGYTRTRAGSTDLPRSSRGGSSVGSSTGSAASGAMTSSGARSGSSSASGRTARRKGGG